MSNTKNLRTAVRNEITNALAGAVQGFTVTHRKENTGAARYVVFTLDALPAFDDRRPYELEVNCVGPDSIAETVEAAADAIETHLDQLVKHAAGFSFYVYRNTRNQVEGSDPHTVRERMTFDLYFYERT